MGDLIIRSAHDSDSTGLIALISVIFSEYPNCTLDVDADMPELRNPATAIRESNGRWWVAELDGNIVGSAAIAPIDGGEAELRRLYVASVARRRGLGEHLVRLVESEAAHREARRIVLWTDTRFEDAHRLYERLGYIRSPGSRELYDISNSIEVHYAKDLAR
jgi:N-acetylglutamate synthase-like GNAT family acetyltransferase